MHAGSDGETAGSLEDRKETDMQSLHSSAS